MDGCTRNENVLDTKCYVVIGHILGMVDLEI